MSMNFFSIIHWKSHKLESCSPKAIFISSASATFLVSLSSSHGQGSSNQRFFISWSRFPIAIGKRLQEMKYLWFEEPCPWEELSETKKVADALEMKIAFGEQDSSLWLFQWMIEKKFIDIVQPDLNYNGGFIRAARVARMARKANMWICPHNTQTGPASVNILQFAAATPTIGPYMEYVSRGPGKKESWYTPK